MPLVNLVTNVKLDEDKIQSFIVEFTKFCSETTGKPENKFMIDFNYNPYLAKGGTFEPAIRMHVIFTLNKTPENVQKWTDAFFKYFEARLGIPTNRGHFSFTDPGDQYIGVNGMTMAAWITTQQ